MAAFGSAICLTSYGSTLWKRYLLPVCEEQRLEHDRDIFAHDSAALISLDVGLQALHGAPAHATLLAAWNDPSRVAVHEMPEVPSRDQVDHIDKGVAHAHTRLEVHGQIEKVVQNLKALIVKKLQKHLSGVIVRQIPQHQSCPRNSIVW